MKDDDDPRIRARTAVPSFKYFGFDPSGIRRASRK
jgi:hypothetical protein